MIRIGVLGATGYTAVELIKLLLRHPEARIAALTSRQPGEPHVASVHPELTGRLDLRLRDLDPAAIAAECDCVFSCLPHGASAQVVKPLVDAGVRVVDFSADYRLNDLAVYRQWYEDSHCDAARLGHVPYGLPELFADQIAPASLVANPGCYPTSAVLGIWPLLEHKLVEPTGIVFDAKSGVSGAGRTPKLATHFPECNESISAYNVGRHRHGPEIDQLLTIAAGAPIETLFTPHLVPMNRGILTTAYATPTSAITESQLLDALRTAYAGKTFVQVVDHLPATKDVSGTNFCQLTARLARGRVVVISCLDNLIKGASGAAVQNFNWMYGFPETTALL